MSEDFSLNNKINEMKFSQKGNSQSINKSDNSVENTSIFQNAFSIDSDYQISDGFHFSGESEISKANTEVKNGKLYSDTPDYSFTEKGNFMKPPSDIKTVLSSICDISDKKMEELLKDEKIYEKLKQAVGNQFFTIEDNYVSCSGVFDENYKPRDGGFENAYAQQKFYYDNKSGEFVKVNTTMVQNTMNNMSPWTQYTNIFLPQKTEPEQKIEAEKETKNTTEETVINKYSISGTDIELAKHLKEKGIETDIFPDTIQTLIRKTEGRMVLNDEFSNTKIGKKLEALTGKKMSELYLHGNQAHYTDDKGVEHQFYYDKKSGEFINANVVKNDNGGYDVEIKSTGKKALSLQKEEYKPKYKDKMELISQGKTVKEIFGDEIKSSDMHRDGGTMHYTLKDGTEIEDYSKNKLAKISAIEINKTNGFSESYNDKGEYKYSSLDYNKFKNTNKNEFLEFIREKSGITNDDYKPGVTEESRNKKISNLCEKLEASGVTCEDNLETIKQKLQNFEAEVKKESDGNAKKLTNEEKKQLDEMLKFYDDEKINKAFDEASEEDKKRFLQIAENYEKTKNLPFSYNEPNIDNILHNLKTGMFSSLKDAIRNEEALAPNTDSI